MKQILDYWIRIKYGSVYAPKPPVNDGSLLYRVRYRLWLVDSWIDRNCGHKRKERWEWEHYSESNPAVRLRHVEKMHAEREKNFHLCTQTLRHENDRLKDRIGTLEKTNSEKDQFIKILEAGLLEKGNIVFRTLDGIEQVQKVDGCHLLSSTIKKACRSKACYSFSEKDSPYKGIPIREYRYTGHRDDFDRPIFEEIEQ